MPQLTRRTRQRGGSVALRAEDEKPGLGVLQDLGSLRALGQTVGGALIQKRRGQLHGSKRSVALVNLELLVEAPVGPVTDVGEDAVDGDVHASVARAHPDLDRRASALQRVDAVAPIEANSRVVPRRERVRLRGESRALRQWVVVDDVERILLARNPVDAGAR